MNNSKAGLRRFSVAVALGLLSVLSRAATWVLDDGTGSLRPEYTFLHTQGEEFVEIYAAFSLSGQRTTVRLRDADAISANDIPLVGISADAGFYYKGRIAFQDAPIEVSLSRSGSAIRHRFSMPLIGLPQPPSVFNPYTPIEMPVNYVEPEAYVDRDSYTLLIKAPGNTFPLDSVKWIPEKYQIGRLPNIADGKIIFKHIGGSAPRPGTYPAELYRQQRITLSKMSDASPSGFATLTTTLFFPINVSRGDR